MNEFMGQFWDQGIDLVTLLVAVFAALAAAGFFRKEKFIRGETLVVEQERDDLRRKLAAAEVRLAHVDPERFLDEITELYDSA